MKNNEMIRKKEIVYAILFLLIVSIILSALSFVFFPIWGPTKELAQYAGLYKESENSLDVIYLGSCNMYTSVSPTLIWEEYGITGYCMTCPDQTIPTSYYYLKDALKTQKPKVVVLESLFLQHGDMSSSRIKYNRYALDYMPFSMNKVKLAYLLSKQEVEISRESDPSHPGFLMTYLSFFFPIIKYHSRNDVSFEEIKNYYFGDEVVYFNKGGWAQFNYTYNDELYWDTIHNDLTISDTAKEYFPKIVELCEQNDIELIVMKSPNNMRWGLDDTYTSVSKNYVEGYGITFLDMQSEEYNTFELYDYGLATGRLNIYGMRRLSHKIGEYLVDNLGLESTSLNEEQTVQWNNCIDLLYEYADEKNMTLNPGQIAQITCGENFLSVRFNEASDCGKYDVYRSIGKSDQFQLVASDYAETVFLDYDVDDCCGYSYYVVPKEGAYRNIASASKYYIYVPMIKNPQLDINSDAIALNWENPDNITSITLYKKPLSYQNYQYCVTIKSKGSDKIQTYSNADYLQKRMCHYRLTAVIKEDDISYYSKPIFIVGGSE